MQMINKKPPVPEQPLPPDYYLGPSDRGGVILFVVIVIIINITLFPIVLFFSNLD